MKKIFIFMLLSVLTLTGCSSNTFNSSSTTSEYTINISEELPLDLSELPYYSYLSDNNPLVTINIKDLGSMELQLFPEVANNTVNNFISYIEDESYSDSTFHRVIKDFMIQGGKVQSTKNPIAGEFSSNGFDNDLSHYRGVISMARTSIADSGTSQFFIMHKDSFFLDGNYAAFGGLVKGFNIVDGIANVSTNYNDAPNNDIVIESITIEFNGYEPLEVVYAK